MNERTSMVRAGQEAARTTSGTERVDLLVIARLDEGAAAELFSCEVYFNLDGSVHGNGVRCGWESLHATEPGDHGVADLDDLLTTHGYTRTSSWRPRLTAAGRMRYFADATTTIETITT